MTNKPERFAPLPKTPNGVCSVNLTPSSHLVGPFFYRGEQEDVQKALVQIIQDMQKTKLIVAEPGYIYFTEHSRVFKFVDDIEISITEKMRRIDFRSASREGYYDFGVNRRRIERLKCALTATFANASSPAHPFYA